VKKKGKDKPPKPSKKRTVRDFKEGQAEYNLDLQSETTTNKRIKTP